MTYPFPPLVPTDPILVARRIGQALGDAFDDIQRERQYIIDHLELLRRVDVLARLAELERSLERFQELTRTEAERFVSQDLPALYADAASQMLPGVAFTWTTLHRDAVIALASDSYGDLLRRSEEAGRTAARFARQVRTVASRTAHLAVTRGITATQAADQMRETLERDYGITAATYRDGSVHSMREYTEMAVRTKSGVAMNYGAINHASSSGVQFFEVFDGSGCGWTTHDDPDKRNGKVVHADDALAHPLSHPNCRRSFGARPDVTTKKQARLAAPSTNEAARLDQAAFEIQHEQNVLRIRPRSMARQNRRSRIAQTRSARTGFQQQVGALMPHPDDTPLQLAMRRAATVAGAYLDAATSEQVVRTTYEMTHRDLTSTVEVVETVNGFTQAQGRVMKGDRMVGFWRRSFEETPQGLVASHDQLELAADVQGQGFATAFNAQAEAFYRTHGVTAITLQAAGGGDYVGGYVWARRGYTWANAKSMRNIAQALEELAGRLEPTVAEQALSLAERLRARDLTVTPYDVSELGHAEAPPGQSWPGRDLMANQTWDGVRWLR